MLVVFIALIAGPLVAARFAGGLGKSVPKIGGMVLVQPDGLNNNDTLNTPTGTALVAALGAQGTADSSASAD